MSDELPILFRNAWRKLVEIIPEPAEFRYREITQQRRMANTPLGPLIERLPTGRADKSQVAIRGNGASVQWWPVRRTKPEIDKRVRRIRPQEHAALVALDAEIEATKARLRQLHEDRKTLLSDAFRRGHTVTVKDITERAEIALSEGRLAY